jgi:hypothetical protein
MQNKYRALLTIALFSLMVLVFTGCHHFWHNFHHMW